MTLDQPDVRHEIDELRAELARLRDRRGLRTPIIVVMLGAAAALAGLRFLLSPIPAEAQAGGNEIACRTLKVVNADGAAVLVLGSDKAGGIITVNGSDGRKRVQIEVDNDGGIITVRGHDEKIRAMVAVDPVNEGGCGRVDINSPDGSRRMYIGATRDGSSGLVNINGADGKSRVILQSDKDGGLLSLRANDGRLRVGLFVDPDGGLINVAGNDSKARVQIGVSDRGAGLINLSDSAGKLVKTLP